MTVRLDFGGTYLIALHMTGLLTNTGLEQMAVVAASLTICCLGYLIGRDCVAPSQRERRAGR